MNQAQIDAVFNQYSNVFPVPLGKIADALGIKIISTAELPEGVSGSITKENDGYLIYVNSTHGSLRQRFTIAHELIHYKKHRSYLDQQHEIQNPTKKALNRPDGGATAVSDDTERRYEYEADQGAADLLMPTAEFTSVFKSSDTLEEVVDHFGVSPAAINVRAYKLNLGYFE